MNNNTFENLFSQFDEQLPSAIATGRILKIISGSDNTELHFIASFEEYVKYVK